MAATNTQPGAFALQTADIGKSLIESYTKLVSYRKVQDRRLETLCWSFSIITTKLAELGNTINKYESDFRIGDEVVRSVVEPCKTALSNLLVIMNEGITQGVFKSEGTIGGQTIVAETDPWFLITMGLGGERDARTFWKDLDKSRDRLVELNDIVKYMILKHLNETKSLDADQTVEFKDLKALLPHIIQRIEKTKKEDERKKKVDEEAARYRNECRNGVPLPNLDRRESEAPSDITLISPQHRAKEARFSKDIDCESISSCSSDSRSVLEVDEIYEEWTLRWVPPHKRVDRSRSIFGLKFRTYFEEEGFWGTDPELRTQAELKDLHQLALAGLTTEKHKEVMQKAIQSIPKKGGAHIDNLLEERTDASTSEHAKREWTIVSVHPKQRFPYSSAKKWGKDPLTTDWVVILRGETVDTTERSRSYRREDPWKRRYRSPTRVEYTSPRQNGRSVRHDRYNSIYVEEPYVRPMPAPRQYNLPRVHIPREVHVDEGFRPATVMVGKVPSAEEAEKKMEEIWTEMTENVTKA